jgi:hypothetical protein
MLCVVITNAEKSGVIHDEGRSQKNQPQKQRREQQKPEPTHACEKPERRAQRKKSLSRPQYKSLNLCSDFTSSNFLEKPSKRGDTKLEVAGHVCSFWAKSTPLGGASLQIDF